MENDSTKISFKQSFLFLGFLVVVIGILMGILSIADWNHKQEIYNRYARETNIYITNNRPALIKLFTEVFPSSICREGDSSTSACLKPPNANQVNQLLPSTLKDWSSTFFIKQVAGNKILAMRLSGDVQEMSIYPQDKEVLVEQLLSGQRETIPWDRYTYLLSTKEVIIPVKDTNNKVIGAIARGTIE